MVIYIILWYFIIINTFVNNNEKYLNVFRSQFRAELRERQNIQESPANKKEQHYSETSVTSPTKRASAFFASLLGD